ncbi:MAG: ABC transporter ATP-binding protein [Rhodocyclaceae bacterium]|jgi:cobalt/nickel transport system ATP-binding protein|nr:ABC transporter ATP-binding protein [Rhodocyclaceae bacterium]
MIELDRIRFGWEEDKPVIDGLSLKIRQGDKAVILGANGCGKSTLLKLMNGLVFPQAGTIRYRGEPLAKSALADRHFARRFRQECALLFQHPEAMLFNPTVREEIAYGPRQLALPEPDACAERWAAAFGLVPRLDQPPFLLSGGEKQKVALACVLAIEPQLLLLDEPSASLDPATVGWLIDTLLEADTTVVAATHNLSLAAELGSRCLVMGEGGRLLYDGPVDAALANLALLEEARLAHRHRHRHGGATHAHLHAHDWDVG